MAKFSRFNISLPYNAPEVLLRTIESGMDSFTDL